MITNIDLERLCNYENNPKATLPSISLTYIDYIVEDDEKFKLELKKHNRDLAIDAILDDKIDEYIENKDKILKEDFQKPVDFNNIPIGSIGNITSNITSNITYPTVSAKVMSMSLKCNKLKDLDTLYNDVIMYLDNITNKPLNTHISCTSLDIKLDTNKTFKDKERKLFTRILSCSNLIAVNSRIGPGSTVLIGDDLVKYFMSGSIINSNINGVLGNLAGLNVIHTPLINPKKVIVLRGSNKPSNGLNVITNVNNGLYYMDKTNGWENTMAWFELL
jgi:CheY-specific phosphatase CheX